MSEITEIPKCNCDSHNNRVCDVCQIYIPEIDRLKTERDRYHKALERIAGPDSIANEDLDFHHSSIRIAREALREVQGE